MISNRSGAKMASLVGLLAAAIAVGAAFLAGAAILDMAGIISLPKWALFGITGVVRSLGVTAFREGQKLAQARPRLRNEVGRMVLFMIGAGVLYAGYHFLSTRKSEGDLQQALRMTQAALTRQLPKQINASTTLVAANVEGTNWTYTYRLSGDRFDTSALENSMRRNFCAGNMKEWVFKGVSFTFEYLDESFNRLALFQVTSCP